MKIVHENLKRGEITLIPENLDDLWHLYNVITPGDIVYAKTLRKIERGEEVKRRKKVEKKLVYLGLKVESVDFHEFTNRLRIKGIIIEAPDNIGALGSYHTINVNIGTQIKIIKEEWPTFILKRIKEAVESARRPKALIVAIEEGEATIAVVGDYNITIVAQIIQSIPGKRLNSKYHDEAIKKFFSDVFKVVEENIRKANNFSVIVVAGPGFVKDHFSEYLVSKTPELSGKVVVDSASSGGENAVYEVLRRGVISKAAEKMRVEEELELIEEFLKRLGQEHGTVTYGMENVEKAVILGAVDTILVTDRKLRESSKEERKKLDEILRETEKKRGKVMIFAANTPAGKQLENFGGIAALLRYRLPDS